MAINSKAPITADQAIKPDKGPSTPASASQAIMAIKCRTRAKPLTVAKLRAIKKRLDFTAGMNNKRDSLMTKGAYPGTGQEGSCMEPTTRDYF